MIRNERSEKRFLWFSIIFIVLTFQQAIFGWAISPFLFAVGSFAVVTFLFFKKDTYPMEIKQ